MSERRLQREAKAIEIVKSIRTYPVLGAIPRIVEPIRPDPTYTFWRHPNDTFPMGSITYFMYSAGRIKIGFSNGLRERHLQFRTSNPFPPIVILVVASTEGAEKKFHARFKADRIHGEWFRLSPALRSFFRSRLCPVGRTSLERAEAEFRDYCEEFLGAYKPPPKRKETKLCEHGKPMHMSCAPCERDRDLKILEALKGRQS